MDHYTCTDWFIFVPDQTWGDAVDPGAGEWLYFTTTCSYMDSFWVDDGTGVGPGGGGGGGPTDLSNRDNLLQGCKTAEGTAKTAEQAHIVGNAGYEWAGFVVKGPDGKYYYSQGELLPLTDNLADIGQLKDHSFPPGYTAVGYYHSHPDRPPTYIDDTTHGHFSASDEKYATDNKLDAYVMLLWTDTSMGTANERSAFYKWSPGNDPGVAGETDNGKETC